MPNLPTGTVTFVFSDIEGSTTLLKQLGDQAYSALLATHRRLVREIFGRHRGQEIDTQGDAFFYSFPRARDAVAAAVEVQRAHAGQAWPEGVAVRMRLGLHTGEPSVGDEGYTGLDVVRASRIAAVGRGGQVLLSETTKAIVAGDLPAGVRLNALGDQRLRDIDRPEPLHELQIEEVPVTSGGRPARSPDWAGELASFGMRAREMIEGRVLAELADSFGAADRKPPRKKPSKSGSVTDQIRDLQALHESGALTDQQYERAVNRVIDEDG
ncbi:MAG: adenylate/guanylate cyclase domain-containing protein [Actinomycetota bacterium]